MPNFSTPKLYEVMVSFFVFFEPFIVMRLFPLIFYMMSHVLGKSNCGIQIPVYSRAAFFREFYGGALSRILLKYYIYFRIDRVLLNKLRKVFRNANVHSPSRNDSADTKLVVGEWPITPRLFLKHFVCRSFIFKTSDTFSYQIQ